MIDPATLGQLVDILRAGGTIMCNAATRDRFVAALRRAGHTGDEIRFRLTPHMTPDHITVILLDGADPAPYALTTREAR